MILVIQLIRKIRKCHRANRQMDMDYKSQTNRWSSTHTHTLVFKHVQHVNLFATHRVFDSVMVFRSVVVVRVCKCVLLPLPLRLFIYAHNTQSLDIIQKVLTIQSIQQQNLSHSLYVAILFMFDGSNLMECHIACVCEICVSCSIYFVLWIVNCSQFSAQLYK